MKAATSGDTIKTIATHYIDGTFVEFHGCDVMNVIRPTDGQVIARLTLADEQDTRRHRSSQEGLRQFWLVDQGRAREDPASIAMRPLPLESMS